MPDTRVLLATIAFCGLATIFFGLGPAWKLSRTNVVPELKEQAGEDARRGRWFGARNLLVGAQIALSLGLLTTAGLFIRGAVKAGQAAGIALEEDVSLVRMHVGVEALAEDIGDRLTAHLGGGISHLIN